MPNGFSFFTPGREMVGRAKETLIKWAFYKR